MIKQTDVRTFLFLFLSVFISFTYSAPVINENSSVPLLLLISLDGFRWDYPEIYELPHFKSLFGRGVRAKHINNGFATLSIPSHFTMATGLYEETHGIIDGRMYDPVLKAVFNESTRDEIKWW